MAFFPRCSGDFVPLFNLLDDYDVHRSTRHRQTNNKVSPVRSFSPKFDVYEVKDRYYLEGELPGVDQNNVEIEFTDPNTLVIKGRSERNYHSEQTDDTSDETASTKSHQPTVEDEDESYDEMSDATPATTPTPASSKQEVVQKRPERPSYKYWISERSIGEFHRTFTFPTRVDQDSVKASLKDGVLTLVLPKEAAPKVKKIRVE